MSLYRFKIGEGALIKLFYTTTDLTQYVPTQATPRIPISITGYGTSTVPQDGDLVVDDYGTFAVVTGEVTVSDNVPQAYVKIISHVAQGVYKISNQALNATVGGTYSIDDANISPSSRLVQKGDVAVDENGRVGVFQHDYDGTGINVITTIYAAGVYQKPSGGIPKTDLAQAVQNSLDKAESALQSVTKSDVGLGNVDNVKQYSASNPPPYPVTSVNNKTGAVSLSKSDVGLGNVDNVKQYSASNPPPYPVTSVNNKTGAVSLSKSDVGLGNVDNVKQYSASNPPPYPVTSVNGDTGDVVVGFTDFSANLEAGADNTYTYCEFQQGAVKGLRIGNQCIIQGRVKCIDFHWVAGSGFIVGAPRADAKTTGRWWLDTMEDGGVVTMNRTGSTLYFTRSGTSGVMYEGEYISFFIMYQTMDATTLAATPAILFEEADGVVLDTPENRKLYAAKIATN